MMRSTLRSWPPSDNSASSSGSPPLAASSGKGRLRKEEVVGDSDGMPLKAPSYLKASSLV